VNAFLTSLKADLWDRRLRAVLLAVCLGLLGALVYALTGGSSGPPGPAAVAASPPSPAGIAAVAAPTNSNQAVAETTSGASAQREGKSRDPFTPLPGSKPTATAASASSSAGSASQRAAKGAAQKTSESSGGSSGGSSSAGSGGTSSKGGKSTPSPHKSKPAYRVAILFGVVPEGTPAQSAQLTPYTDLKLGKKLPSSGTPLLSFHEVTAGGKRAVFQLIGEVFLKGSVPCSPSASQCKSIALAQGQSEEVEYLPAGGGRPVVYDLQVVSITTGKAAAARARISLLHLVHARALLASPAPAL
jgi:hypothetical protein